MSAEPMTAPMIDHDARMIFDQMMRDLIARDVDPADALAALRRVARDGNGWG